MSKLIREKGSLKTVSAYQPCKVFRVIKRRSEPSVYNAGNFKLVNSKILLKARNLEVMLFILIPL